MSKDCIEDVSFEIKQSFQLFDCILGVESLSGFGMFASEVSKNEQLKLT